MKNLIIILFIIFSSSAFGQSIGNFRAQSVAIKLIDEKTDKWQDWSDWMEISWLIKMNFTDKRFIIYANPKETYDIIRQIDTNNNENDKIKFRCIDNKGAECTFWMSNKNENLQLYLEFDNAIIVYNIKELKN